MAEASDCRIIIFAKAPIAGQVKTRLCPPLSADDAAKLQRRMIRHTLNTASLADLGPVELHCAPDSQYDFFMECSHDFAVQLQVQSGDDLGMKMQNALAREHRAILVGTDCPSITAKYLRDAAAAIAEENSIVFGPAEDGGYGLIGVNGATPNVFVDVPWGSADVMNVTRNILSATGRRWHELEPIWDVDRPDDLARLARDGNLKHLTQGLNFSPTVT
jgi:uncharacterized protein